MALFTPESLPVDRFGNLCKQLIRLRLLIQDVAAYHVTLAITQDLRESSQRGVGGNFGVLNLLSPYDQRGIKSGTFTHLFYMFVGLFYQTVHSSTFFTGCPHVHSHR